ncbi:hypothetical protein EJP82_06795 [Paenibacillus anaericanus]|uniref:2-keto-3-deoxygluconate kinase n=1 Tax=Paenibacillus anaericanus TaxID=170367 RepID=A0A3S1DU46_9BACL|nr:hypothetical protein [Paenibacillus anaericanus]RUT47411.1 hypothetical protein EJP82_06795 [Paenibacillus anaericanus]
MREGFKGKHHGHREHREHRGLEHMDKHGHKESCEPHPKSAQTFRRGRATAFLDKLNVNRATLQRQLNEPELESIKQVISGELKATEAIIEEFIHMFQLHEISSEDRTSNNNKNDGDGIKNDNNQFN